jgi:7-cyano-7-deazaguanine synthase
VTEEKTLAVVCVSGGMDSAVTAAAAAEVGHTLAFLHANYGQRTEGKELACFQALADHFAARLRLVVDFPVFAAIGGSSLTDRRIPVREGEPEEGHIPTSYVPFRNAHLLAAATSWAELIGARALFVGAVWEDSSGYPDCRPEFYAAYEEAIRQGTRPETSIRIVTPVIGLSKAGIVRRGTALGVPFGKTWSCYQAEDRPCGVCESCRLRHKGFAEAGVADPLE